MTEQELKDAITSACEADYKHEWLHQSIAFQGYFERK